jgi:hypothetical protein
MTVIVLIGTMSGAIRKRYDIIAAPSGTKLSNVAGQSSWLVPRYPPHDGGEAGEIESQTKYTCEGDRVIIIGGGDGISAVFASRAAGASGEVTVYEGGDTYCTRIRNILTINSVPANWKVEEAVVGPPRDVYDADDATRTISPSELPSCDVLELDCEGSEETIIQQLEIRPRVITIELHPERFEGEPDAIFEHLIELNYHIVDCLNNRTGEAIRLTILREIVTDRRDDYIPHPVIICLHDNCFTS